MSYFIFIKNENCHPADIRAGIWSRNTGNIVKQYKSFDLKKIKMVDGNSMSDNYPYCDKNVCFYVNDTIHYDNIALDIPNYFWPAAFSFIESDYTETIISTEVINDIIYQMFSNDPQSTDLAFKIIKNIGHDLFFVNHKFNEKNIKWNPIASHQLSYYDNNSKHYEQTDKHYLDFLLDIARHKKYFNYPIFPVSLYKTMAKNYINFVKSYFMIVNKISLDDLF